MLWWSQEPISSATTASLFKLEPGQDKTFANALVQRLAEAFRTGNNLTRFCVLKVFLLASKGPKLKNRCNTGLFKKERIANYPEVLRRVKAVLDSGDTIARALALRLIGCLAELAFDSVDVHRLVFEALQSPHHKEVSHGSSCTRSFHFLLLVHDQYTYHVVAVLGIDTDEDKRGQSCSVLGCPISKLDDSRLYCQNHQP